MKSFKSLSAAVLLLATMTAGASAMAHGGHGGHHHGGGRVGVFIGAPVFGFGLPYYGYPAYGYAPYGYYGYRTYGYAPYGYYGPATTVITPSAPPVYIEQSSVNATGPAADGFWYYCSNPDGYYPYVRQCPGGWQQVPTQPAQR